jgi:hypothetical protein
MKTKTNVKAGVKPIAPSFQESKHRSCREKRIANEIKGKEDAMKTKTNVKAGTDPIETIGFNFTHVSN